MRGGGTRVAKRFLELGRQKTKEKSTLLGSGPEVCEL